MVAAIGQIGQVFVRYGKAGIGHNFGFFYTPRRNETGGDREICAPRTTSLQIQVWEGHLAAVEAGPLYPNKNLTNLTTNLRVAAGGARRDGATRGSARPSGASDF